MSSLLITALIGGALAAAGLMAALYLLVVPRRPALGSLLDSASHRPELRPLTSAPPMAADPGRRVLIQSFLVRLLDRPWLAIPQKDLAILEKTRSEFVLERAGWFVVGLLVLPLWSVLMWLLGAPPPPPVPALGSLVVAALAWKVSGSRVAARARERRQEMRYALVSYITVVAMHRATGLGAAASLEAAASSSDSWAFRRIDQEVSTALRSHRTAWQALQDLADELDITELGDLSSIAENAGVDGAQIGATLLARAASLRNELFAQEQRRASDATDRLLVPKLILAFVMLGFIIFALIGSLFTARGRF